MTPKRYIASPFAVVACSLFIAHGAMAEAELDFTSNVWKDGWENVTVDGVTVTVTLSSFPANRLSFVDDGTQNGGTTSFSGGPLAEDFDGIGIGDDEIGGTEELTIDFGGVDLYVTGAAFLDLFFSEAPSDVEKIALRYYRDGAELSDPPSPQVFEGVQLYTRGASGWLQQAFAGVLADHVKVVFFEGNDNTGVGDAAMAALRVQVVPIPAAAWLFGSALLGMVGVGARRAKKA